MSEDTLMGCKIAPSGRHCLHDPSGTWGVQRSQICCWCGNSIQMHGDFLPVYPNNNWWGTTTTPQLTITGNTFTPNTSAASNGGLWFNGNTIPPTFTSYPPSGSVGHGG